MDLKTSSRLVAIVGPTATGKSELAIALAECLDGEIVSCDSTAVYRGFDIGTDKVPIERRRGVPHHLIDVADPYESYSAARYATEASAVVRAIVNRGRLPILVGGSGLYYRALTRGLFPGPSRDGVLRNRLQRIAARRGVEYLHRMVGRVDPDSACRIQARDERRLVRALEVYYLTGKSLTAHFAETRSPLADFIVTGIGLQQSREQTAVKVAQRVDEQFAAGLLDEIRLLRARGVPDTAPPFGGMVYRQALAFLNGFGDEASTRELIVRENQRYARRQLIWFRKEPNLQWIQVDNDPMLTFIQSKKIIHALEN